MLNDDFEDTQERDAGRAEWYEMLWSIEYELERETAEWIDVGGEGG